MSTASVQHACSVEKEVGLLQSPGSHTQMMSTYLGRPITPSYELYIREKETERGGGECGLSLAVYSCARCLRMEPNLVFVTNSEYLTYGLLTYKSSSQELGDERQFCFSRSRWAPAQFDRGYEPLLKREVAYVYTEEGTESPLYKYRGLCTKVQWFSNVA